MDNGASSYRRFLEGDDSGLAELVRDYKDGLTLYLNGFVQNIHLAEDLMEDTFFKLLVKKPRFREKYSFKTWLYTIGRNVALDHLRRRKKLSDTPIEDYENTLTEEGSVETAYLRQEQRITVHRALRALKTEYRQVLYLVYFEDFSVGDAATAMGKSKHQTENLLYRAKGALRAELGKVGFVYEEL